MKRTSSPLTLQPKKPKLTIRNVGCSGCVAFFEYYHGTGENQYLAATLAIRTNGDIKLFTFCRSGDCVVEVQNVAKKSMSMSVHSKNLFTFNL